MPASRTSRPLAALAASLLAAVAGSGCSGSTEQGCTPAAEACNGLDDDCDGAVDEGLGELTCGVGICRASVPACVAGEARTCTPGAANPAEGCDGLDDDCDGTVDEGCDCLDDATQPCYGGPPGTPGVGACRAGSQTCVGGAWGACVGAQAPTAELCNLVDDDCDGEVDDGDPGGGAACGTGAAGACAAGVERCGEDGEIACAQVVFPAAELCNGVDDDCDGQTDEGFGVGVGCSAGTGACFAMGVTACLPDGTGAACDAQPGTPAAEDCNGADDDCDGSIDEELVGAACPKQLGVCSGSTAVCGVDGWECSQESYGPYWEPVETMCDAHDNDCDGVTNEGLTLTVHPDADRDGWGALSGASQACTRLDGWALTAGDCDDTRASTHPDAPELCNLVDDDCDGVVDDGC